MTTDTETPRVWVGCLAAYNNGKLHGKWVDVPTDPDELHEEIQAVLKSSPEPLAEEWAFMDNEGFGPLKIGEYESVERVCKIAAGVEEHGAAFLAYLDNFGEDIDGDDFDEKFRGEWDSERAFAEDMVDSCGIAGIPPGASLEHVGSYGGGDKVNALDALSCYLNWDTITRDVMMDHVAVDARGGGVYVFASY